MFEYYDKLNSLSEEKLVEEMTMLQKKLLACSNTNSMMYDQLLDMLDAARSAYHEKSLKHMQKDQKDDSIIELGTIESTVNEINYADQDDLLQAIVNEYKS